MQLVHNQLADLDWDGPARNVHAVVYENGSSTASATFPGYVKKYWNRRKARLMLGYTDFMARYGGWVVSGVGMVGKNIVQLHMSAPVEGHEMRAPGLAGAFGQQEGSSLDGRGRLGRTEGKTAGEIMDLESSTAKHPKQQEQSWQLRGAGGVLVGKQPNQQGGRQRLGVGDRQKRVAGKQYATPMHNQERELDASLGDDGLGSEDLAGSSGKRHKAAENHFKPSSCLMGSGSFKCPSHQQEQQQQYKGEAGMGRIVDNTAGSEMQHKAAVCSSGGYAGQCCLGAVPQHPEDRGEQWGCLQDLVVSTVLNRLEAADVPKAAGQQGQEQRWQIGLSGRAGDDMAAGRGGQETAVRLSRGLQAGSGWGLNSYSCKSLEGTSSLTPGLAAALQGNLGIKEGLAMPTRGLDGARLEDLAVTALQQMRKALVQPHEHNSLQ